MIKKPIRGPGIAVRQNGPFLLSALREGSLLAAYAEDIFRFPRRWPVERPPPPKRQALLTTSPCRGTTCCARLSFADCSGGSSLR